jgi:lycopene beta-cyclase
VSESLTADVVVIGDGPAGSALASALHRRGVDVVLVGPDEPWSATYGTWADDVEAAAVLGGSDIWLHRLDSIAVHFADRRIIDRAYGVIDNRKLRTVLRDGVRHQRATLTTSEIGTARIVVDATGWPSSIAAQRPTTAHVAWQTAYGVVLAAPPSGVLGQPLMMDFSQPDVAGDVEALGATFAYALPVEDGWLVEETVLAAHPAIEPERLALRLARRLAMSVDELGRVATRIERVRIPMGAPARRSAPGSNVVPYGAAAGMIHPATGYSIAATLRAADPVAERIADVLAAGSPHGSLAHIVWSDEALRTRALHDYGLSVLQKMDVDEVCAFFDAFFDAPLEQWSAFLRIESSPIEVARLMATMFRRADWSLRRRLVAANPVPLMRALR